MKWSLTEREAKAVFDVKQHVYRGRHTDLRFAVENESEFFPSNTFEDFVRRNFIELIGGEDD